MRKPLIYQYDKNKNTERLVDIYDICRKNYLYEIKNKSGVISDKEINLIEKGFSRLELIWDKIIDKIEQRKDVTEEDRYMLGVLLVLQLMRMPEVMEFTSDWLYDFSVNTGKVLTKNEVDRYMKLASFVWGETKPETNWILNILLEKIFADKDIAIYHSKSGFILNGNRPVLCLKTFGTDEGRNCMWLLPITRNYCIGLVNKGTISYMNIDAKLTHFINMQNFQNNGRFIYGSKSITQMRCKTLL